MSFGAMAKPHLVLKPRPFPLTLNKNAFKLNKTKKVCFGAQLSENYCRQVQGAKYPSSFVICKAFNKEL